MTTDHVIEALRRGPSLIDRLRIRWAGVWHQRAEVWIRHDVAGHSIGCAGRPTVVHGGGRVLRCDCWASSWRRRWPR